MKIYTKTGDEGQTRLGNGAKVSKADVIVETYGNLDELNAIVGWVLAAKPSLSVATVLHKVQIDLFAMGSVVANPKLRQRLAQFDESGEAIDSLPQELRKVRLTDEDVVELEQSIDSHEEKLEPLKQFILPRGCEAASRLHMARTVVRRAERQFVRQSAAADLPALYLIYLNRLSDLLFVLARYENSRAKIEDTPW